jgi:hypothetical protein
MIAQGTVVSAGWAVGAIRSYRVSCFWCYSIPQGLRINDQFREFVVLLVVVGFHVSY